MAIPKPKSINIATDEVRIEVPWQESGAQHFPHVRIDMNLRQAKTVRFVRDALEQRGAKLSDGTYVNSHHDAVRYMIDAVADKIGVNAQGKIEAKA